MAEYIEREAVRDELYFSNAITMRGVAILNKFPTADVIPVVHCKECRHMTNELGYRYCNVWQGINGYGDDGFCNYGERETE